MSGEASKLVGTWGYETAGVYLNVGQFFPDGSRVVYTQRNGKTQRSRDQWNLNQGVLSMGSGAPYRVKFESSESLILTAMGPVPIGFDTIRMRRYSSNPSVDPNAGLAWARSVRNNRPISQEARAFMDEIKSRPSPTPQRQHQSQKCHRCYGGGSIGTATSYVTCPECNGSGRL